MQALFTDVMGNISLSSGVVRMDMLRMMGEDSETRQPQLEVNGHVAIPLEGFLRTLENMERVRNSLIESGVLTKKMPNQ